MAGIWLANILLLSSGGDAVEVYAEASRRQSYHNTQNNNRRNRPHHQQNGPPRPTLKDMFDEDNSSASYFERYGLDPPKLLSRESRRRAQADTLFADTEVPENTQDTPTDIESIIHSAKHGNDANSRLRYDLIYNNFYYDKHSYPWEYVWYNQTGKLTGVPIETNINFHRVFSVDVVNSVIDLVVWFRLYWFDPRLTWKPEEYGGLTHAWFWIGDGGAGGETSELWTPDVELWNLETGLKGSLEDTYARVKYDGTVWWSRPGHLRPTCKFKGLESFPFDNLSCTMEFGSWVTSGKYLNMQLWDGIGYSIGGSETSGEAYEEYSFVEEDPIVATRHVYTYQSAPDDDWPVLLYNVTVSRSWQPYARGYIATQIILNLVGFSAFWLPPSCGERMSLSITAMLAALAAEIVIAANLPAASEMTWFSKFSILSTAFAFIALVESVAVLYFYYKRSEDCVPEWYSFTKNWYLVRQARKQGERVKNRSSEMVQKTTDFVSETTSTLQSTTINAVDALTGRRLSADNENDEKTDRDQADGFYTPNGSETGSSSSAKVTFSDESARPRSENKGVGNQRSEYGRFSVSSNPPNNSFSKRGSMMSTQSGLATPINANDFHTEDELENNMKWKQFAARIDDVARYWIPLAFIISLSIILAAVM